MSKIYAVHVYILGATAPVRTYVGSDADKLREWIRAVRHRGIKRIGENMDPNENIKIQREVSKAILAAWDGCNTDGTLTTEQQEWVADQANLLAEAVKALDDWIKNGGFLPADWDWE